MEHGEARRWRAKLHSEIFDPAAAGVLKGVHDMRVGNETESNDSLRTAKTTAKKKLIRRTDRDYSQALRRGYQFAFFLMNVWLGGQFYLWVRHYETAGASAYVSRPAGVEGWLPIAGMMNFKYFLLTGRVPELHPAAMFLLVTFVAIALLFRKAFCSWLCPAGTVSEYLGKLGKKIFGRNFYLPRWVDVPLRGWKYLLLGFFVWAVSSMSAKAIAGFMQSPYGIVADVVLNFFRFIGSTGLIVVGVLVGHRCRQNFWCRYLCPYGRCRDCRRCSARFAFGGMNRRALIARSVPRLARPRCRWTSWSRSSRRSALGVWVRGGVSGGRRAARWRCRS